MSLPLMLDGEAVKDNFAENDFDVTCDRIRGNFSARREAEVSFMIRLPFQAF